MIKLSARYEIAVAEKAIVLFKDILPAGAKVLAVSFGYEELMIPFYEENLAFVLLGLAPVQKLPVAGSFKFVQGDP